VKQTPPIPIGLDELISRWDGFLIDAYGVLVDGTGALPGAARFISRLRERQAPFRVVTNDASRLPENIADRLTSLGVSVAAEEVLTSGAMLTPFFGQRGLRGAPTLVLGTSDAKAYVTRAGGVVVEMNQSPEPDVVAVCDHEGFDFLPTMEAALSLLLRRADAGRPIIGVLPNPDLIYPHSPGAFGFTAGAMALLLEAAVAARHPALGWKCQPLGKPHPPLFEEAARQLGAGLVMIGDQLHTDILGARNAGIDAVLIGTGVSQWTPRSQASACEWPDFLLPSLV